MPLTWRETAHEHPSRRVYGWAEPILFTYLGLGEVGLHFVFPYLDDLIIQAAVSGVVGVLLKD
jgi:hypothetical protein